jgi:hypothetical protein
MTPLKITDPGLSVFQKVVLAISIILFIVSLSQPAFYIGRKDYDAYADGKFLVMLGWMSFMGGNFIASLIWLANPCFLISLILTLIRNPAGFYFSILACLLSLSFSLLDSTMTSESGSYSKITSLENGYKLWVASMLVLTVGTSFNKLVLKAA